MFRRRLGSIMPRLHKLAPYLLVELLLPGGTLIAMLLWLSQSTTSLRGGAAQSRQLPPRAVAERVVDRPRPLRCACAFIADRIRCGAILNALTSGSRSKWVRSCRLTRA